MSATFFTSDLHFGHTKVAEIRGFSSVADHDKTLIDNWNSVVKEGDVVWLLGDLAIEGQWKYALALLPELRGRIRLVDGNHDRCWMGKSDGAKYAPAYLGAGFELVAPWARVKVGSTKVMLSHFPYSGDRGEDRHSEYRLRTSKTPILHGHTHSAEKFSLAASGANTEPEYFEVPQLHVGVDAWDLKPVASFELEKLL